MLPKMEIYLYGKDKNGEEYNADWINQALVDNAWLIYRGKDPELATFVFIGEVVMDDETN